MMKESMSCSPFLMCRMLSFSDFVNILFLMKLSFSFHETLGFSYYDIFSLTDKQQQNTN